MRFWRIRPCPLCSGPAVRRQLGGWECYHRILCRCCGTFVVEPTLPLQSWARLRPEDLQLAAFLPPYIRHRNRRDHVPLITLRNWRALARRGHMVVQAQSASGDRPPLESGQLQGLTRKTQKTE
jgi:hypothetical protein